jgi:Complex1_LYR-like
MIYATLPESVSANPGRNYLEKYLPRQRHHTVMRCTLVVLAEPLTSRPLNIRHASASLLPPIPCVDDPVFHSVHSFDEENVARLYRRLLRAHRALPHEMRSLGDDYVRAGKYLNVHVYLYVVLIGCTVCRVSPAQRRHQSSLYYGISFAMEAIFRSAAKFHRRVEFCG